MNDDPQSMDASTNIIKVASSGRWQHFVDTCCSQSPILTQVARSSPTSNLVSGSTTTFTSSSSSGPATVPSSSSAPTHIPTTTPIFRCGPLQASIVSQSTPTLIPMPAKVEQHGQMQITTYLPPIPRGPAPSMFPLPAFISRPKPDFNWNSDSLFKPTSFSVPYMYLPRPDLVPRPSWNLEYARARPLNFTQSQPRRTNHPRVETEDHASLHM